MLADKFGRKSLMYVNLVMFIVISILSACSWSLTSFLFFRFWVGFWVGADYPICAAYLAEITQLRRGKSVAIIRIINALGYPAGALVAYLVIQVDHSNDAWRWMFLIGAIPAIVGSALRTRLPESFDWQSAQRLKTSLSGLKTLFSRKYHKNTIIASSCYALKDISEYGIQMFMPTIIIALQIQNSSNQFEEIANALKIALFSSAAILGGCILAKSVIDKMDRRKFQFTWFLLSAICLFSLGFGQFNSLFASTIYIAAMFITYNFVEAMVGTTTYLIPAEIYPTAIRATGHGFVASMGKLGAFIGTLFLPAIEHAFGIYVTVMIMAIPLLLGALLTSFYPRNIARMNLS
jgi:MFS family permease